MENLAYGYLLTSAVAKGSIQAMDTSVAEHATWCGGGVHSIPSAEAVPGTGTIGRGSSGEIVPPLQDRKILNYGQIIGLVVADSFEQARDAAALVRTQYARTSSGGIVGSRHGNMHLRAWTVGGEQATIEFLAKACSRSMTRLRIARW